MITQPPDNNIGNTTEPTVSPAIPPTFSFTAAQPKTPSPPSVQKYKPAQSAPNLIFPSIPKQTQTQQPPPQPPQPPQQVVDEMGMELRSSCAFC